MKRKKTTIFLLLIFFLAAFWRFYRLSSVPPSLSMDEVSLGWNAYSLLETGSDEYGNRWPVLLRAYDDWRPALQAYLTIPSVALAGLTPLAVRFPAVLLGSLSVFVIYFLTTELFAGKKWSRSIGLGASFLLAISPWHLYLSRLNHEVGTNLFFTLLGLWLFFLFINRGKGCYLVFSSVIFALSFYTYQSQKIFAPVFLIIAGLIYRQRLFRHKKIFFLSILIGMMLIIPVLKTSLSPGGMVRFEASSLFQHSVPVVARSVQRQIFNRTEPNLLGVLFDNQKTALFLEFLKAYFSHFSPVWLYFNSLDEWHKVPGLGLFFLWELLFLAGGVCFLLKKSIDRKTKYFLGAWLAAAPLPAAITTQAPHAMRALNMLPPFLIIEGMGVWYLLQKLKTIKGKLRMLVSACIFLILLLSFLFFGHNYFVNFPREQSDSFQYSLSQAIDYVLEREDDFDQIVFSINDQTRWSYMFFLFQSRYEPRLYLQQGGTVSGGFAEIHFFGKYEFRPIDQASQLKNKKILYVDNYSNGLPSGAVGKEFSNLYGDPKIIVYWFN